MNEENKTLSGELQGEPAPGGEQAPWDTYSQELGISPVTGHESPVTELPHETRASNETKENLAELTEANADAVKAYRLYDPAEVGEAREDERFGRILHAAHFLEILRKTGLVAVYTKCQAAKGLRHLAGDEKARERIAQYERTTAGLVTMGSVGIELPRPVYVTWVQIPWMIEYSVMRFDRHGLATKEKYRGWRTVLIELIRQHYVSEAECNRAFGEPRGPAAKRWGEILASIRSN